MLLVIICVLGAAWSFFIAARPEVGFFLEEGWKFRDAEPSDLYLGVTRFGAAVAGVALLVFAAIFAFGGPSDGGEPEKQPAESEEQVQDNIDEWVRLARAECDRLMPTFGKVPKWDAQGKITNPDALHALAAREGVELEIQTMSNGSDLVAVHGPVSSAAGKRIWPFFTIDQTGTTCIA